MSYLERMSNRSLNQDVIAFKPQGAQRLAKQPEPEKPANGFHHDIGSNDIFF